MWSHRKFTAVALLAIPLVAASAGAQDTTRTRDSLRIRDSLQQDSLRRMRQDSVAARRAAARITQQDTARRVTSERRIRVSKEAGGEVDLSRNTRMSRADLLRADSLRVDSLRADSIAQVERMRADSIAAVEKTRADSVAAVEKARADSVAAIERARTDSIAAVERMRADSVARADSLAREEQLRRQRERDRYLFNGSGWYLGVSGGTAMPGGDFKDLGYDQGFNVNVPIGYHARNQLLGVRLDLGYSQFSGRNFTGIGTGGSSVTLNNSDPKVVSAALNLTARLPLGRNFNLYALGGGGMYHFRSYGPTSALSGFLGNDVLDNNDEAVERTKTKFGSQAGVGVDFGVGPMSLFLESRVVNVVADRAGDNTNFNDFFGTRGKNVRWVPIVLGINFR